MPNGDTETVTITVASIMSDVGDIFAEAMEWAGDVATEVTSNPLLLLFVVIPVVGLGIGIFKRLLRL